MPAEELQAVVEMLAASAAGGEGLGTGLDTRLGAVPQCVLSRSLCTLSEVCNRQSCGLISQNAFIDQF